MILFWFRRDLRLEDNCGLYQALKRGQVLPLYIFDEKLLKDSASDDPRQNFIYQKLKELYTELRSFESSLLVIRAHPLDAFKMLLEKYPQIKEVHANEEYDPYSIKRDAEIKELLESKGIPLILHKDSVIFAKNEILTLKGKPLLVFSQYKRKWLEKLNENALRFYPSEKLLGNLYRFYFPLPDLNALGFRESKIKVKRINFGAIKDYGLFRDYPALDHTSYASPHLRYGTISIRKLVKIALSENDLYLSELIWREFFLAALYHFPEMLEKPLDKRYDLISWRNEEEEFERWKEGKTGYPLVDAGMRQLKETGYLHNRVRMVCASFLVKHLLIDWRWGERYFAEKLLDYDPALNVGNWQWVLGSAFDPVPYIRIFNPIEQQKRFDPKMEYVKRWVPELGTPEYPKPIVDHRLARMRALQAFERALKGKSR